jgi:hypothetical protein
MRDDDAMDRILADCRAYMQERGMTFECMAAAENLELIL